LKHIELYFSSAIILYGYKTWSVTVREKYYVRIFENKVLKTLGAHKPEVTGRERKIQK